MQGRAPEPGGSTEETLLRSVMGLRAKLPEAAGGTTNPPRDASGAPPPLPPVQMVHMWEASEVRLSVFVIVILIITLSAAHARPFEKASQ